MIPQVSAQDMADAKLYLDNCTSSPTLCQEVQDVSGIEIHSSLFVKEIGLWHDGFCTVKTESIHVRIVGLGAKYPVKSEEHLVANKQILAWAARLKEQNSWYDLVRRYDCTHHMTDRGFAEQILKGRPCGSWLLRTSGDFVTNKNPHGYVLSELKAVGFTHTPIEIGFNAFPPAELAVKK